VLLLFVVLLARTFQIYKVEGISMEPTLHPGQGLILVKFPWLAGGIHDDDIIVVRDASGSQRYIKRVYKTAGERVEAGLSPQGPHVEPEFLNELRAESDFTVPEGTVYVLGDNREHSEDSRDWGPVPLERVEGKALFAPGVIK